MGVGLVPHPTPSGPSGSVTGTVLINDTPRGVGGILGPPFPEGQVNTITTQGQGQRKYISK
jgi:hypothetical protein